MRFYLETPRTSASMRNLISMTTVSTGIRPWVFLMTRSTMVDGSDFYTDSAKQWFVTL